MKQYLEEISLNGWWDFKPSSDEGSTGAPPVEGWKKGAYLVPSVWNCPPKRMGGRDFDAFGYPASWDRVNSAWVRRTFSWAASRGGRYFLKFDAVAPRAEFWLNGESVAEALDPCLPTAIEVTDRLVDGINTLCVHVRPFQLDERGRSLVPSGNDYWLNWIRGIWQDVSLIRRGSVVAERVEIRSEFRRTRLKVKVETDGAVDTSVSARIVEWHPGKEPWEGVPFRKLSRAKTDLRGSVEWTIPVSGIRPWMPESPALYWLLVETSGKGGVSDRLAVRFGFREVVVDGPDLLVNGVPVHLFSDWGHRPSPFHCTAAWNRKWFGMMRDANLNHSRLHTYPHPPVVLDLADEMGILITGETALHGSGRHQAGDSPEYWEAARQHAYRMIDRDGHHPSVILWSVENEMRWNGDETRLAHTELPKLREAMSSYDPTRVSYHEGDTSLWDETRQPIISRHYGRDVAGFGWWDRKVPLHVGEMALYHYAGPNNTLHLGGDAVYADHREISLAAAQDAAWIIEAARTNGVCALGPWNLSSLENMRLHGDMTFRHRRFDEPGMKVLRASAGASEFEFWKKGRGYHPFVSFAVQTAAFRRIAVVDNSRRSQYFVGRELERELHVINDGVGELVGSVRVSVGELACREFTVRVARGMRESVKLVMPLDLSPGRHPYRFELWSDGKCLDSWTRRWLVADGGFADSAPLGVLVYGRERDAAMFAALGLNVEWLESLREVEGRAERILVVGAGMIERGDDAPRYLRRFLGAGGRALLLEQEVSVFRAMPLEARPVVRAFRRGYGHAVLRGIRDGDLDFWGDDAYVAPNCDAVPAKWLYRKNDGSGVQFLVDAGEGGFGDGDLGGCALLEVREGDGVLLGCQLRVSECWDTIPTARRLLQQMVGFLRRYRPSGSMVKRWTGAVPNRAELKKMLKDGGTLLVDNPSDAKLRDWRISLKAKLEVTEPDDLYQIVRASDDDLLAGFSNEDGCGIFTFSYSPPQPHRRLGKRLMRPESALEPLLIRPHNSLLTELFVEGGQLESRRAAVVSKARLGKDSGPAEIAMGRVRVGRGSVVISLLPRPEGGPIRLRRLSRLLARLVGEETQSVFYPKVTPDGDTRFNGAPIAMWQRPCDASFRNVDDLLTYTVPRNEHIAPAQVLELGGWQEIQGASGTFRVEGQNANASVWLYTRVVSPVPRLNLETNAAAPNPGNLTFLHLAGQGRISVVLNATVLAADLDLNGAALIPDVALNKGHNHFLVRWTPLALGGELGVSWRTIGGQPEQSLRFT